MQSERRESENEVGNLSADEVGILNRTPAVFLVSLVVRLVIAAVFLGSVDTVNSLSYMPVAASHGYFYLPYFPVVENILGASGLLMNHVHFIPISAFPKILPCVADSLVSVWLLRFNRFDATFRRRAAWIYTFCPLTIILVCLAGQWDSLWILPTLAALALSMQTRDDSPDKYRACLIIGLLLGVAVIAKPVALVVAGLLIPNVHSRSSLTSWFREMMFIATGAILSAGTFMGMFAIEGINLRRNLDGVVGYGGSPGFIVFGPAHLKFFDFLSHLHKKASVIGDFRTFALIYVLAIVFYQIFSKAPVHTMAAAASMLLIAPAIGGLAAQYLVWPLVFIMAAGRLRLAIVYSAVTSFVLLIFFLIPGSSVLPGENIGTFLPLHSLRYLGVPKSVLDWAATTTFTNDVWLPILNLYLPMAMCALALYLFMSKWRAKPFEDAMLLRPSDLRSTRVCVPYATLLAVAVITYWLEPTHVENALVGVVQKGISHYSFARSIYSWSKWQELITWGVPTPYKDVIGGAWWGSIIVVGPILIAIWTYLAIRNQPRTSDAPEVEQVRS